MNKRQVVLVALLALAEASVIEPLLLLLPTPLRFVDSGIALAVTWVLLCGIAFSRRWMAVRDASATVQRVVLGVWLVSMLITSVVVVNLIEHLDPYSLSILFIEFGGVTLIWWRGTALGTTILEPDSARLRLQLGLLFFIMFALLTVFNPPVNLLIFIVPFLVGAAFAMPLSHIERVEQSVLGRPVAMDGRWWRSLILGVGAPLSASIVLAMLVSGDLLASGLRLIVAVLLIPFLAVAFVVGYLISLLIALLFNKGQRNPLEGLQGLNNLLNQITAKPDQITSPVFNISPEARYAIGIIVLAVIIGVLVWFTSRARRAEAIERAKHEDLQDLQDEETGPPPSFIGGLFNSLSLRRWLAAITIRRIYARMSHEAGKRGYARSPAQTPYDYLPALANAFPDAHADLHIITNAYIAAHYGEVPDTDEALGQIRSAWDRVRLIPKQIPIPKETTEV